jgi:glycine/D-amino acid oxidase-like deaminating enzyme
VAPVRHQLLITEPAAGVDRGQPIVRVVDAAVYLRPARGGLMVGGFEAGPLPVDPRARPASFRTGDLELELGVLTKMTGQVAVEVPLAGELAVAEHRGGLFTMTPDGRFVAGPVPDAPGLRVASGCNGSGFSSSLALGEARQQAQVTCARRARSHDPAGRQRHSVSTRPDRIRMAAGRYPPGVFLTRAPCPPTLCKILT